MQVLIKKFELVRDGITYQAGTVADLPADVAAELISSAPKEFAYLDVDDNVNTDVQVENEKLDDASAANVVLEEMTVAQLQQLAAENGITLAKSAKKADIIAAINAIGQDEESLPAVDAGALVK